VASREREGLAAGDRLQGPALVFERHSATFVDEGWELAVDAYGHLVLERRLPADRVRVSR
jgi:N-methylhydantoinase A/oxoprolinase/acetone carboxylase beta subunit